MLSLILPARNWPCDRIEACVRSFLRLKSKTLTEIVIVDFGSKEPIAVKVKDKRVRIVRVEAERWSAGEATNIGVTVARNAICAKADSDIIVSRTSGPGIDRAVAEIAKGDLGFAVVQATDLPDGVEAAEALEASDAELSRKGRLRARWGQGGLCFFSADVWNEIGGVESRFHGWGNEDNDFPERIRRSGRRLRWIDRYGVKIFHVYHPPRYAAKDIVKARTANQEIYATDKSTLRPMRFVHSRKSSLPAPNLANAPRPLVTVAFASKSRTGRERMLNEAIRGFAGQIENDFEVVVADNGSNDEQKDLLRKSLKKLPRSINVRVVDVERPLIPGARNAITHEARGRYICVADDDDIPLATRLSDHLACFERDPGIHGSHGGWIDFDELTGIIDFNTGGTRLVETLMYGRGKVTAHPASFYRRDAMLAVPYDETFKVGSDLDMALRMTNMGFKVAHTESYVTLRRFHEVNVTVTDLGGQLNNGVEARNRIAETFGLALEMRLRDLGKAVPPKVPCKNEMTKDQVAELIPAYCGVWRLVVPLGDLARTSENTFSAIAEANGDSTTASRKAVVLPLPTGGALRASQQLIARAEELARLMPGDVGVLDSGINPNLHFVSDPIKGVAKALKFRQAIDDRLSLTAELLPDVEYERRRMKRFDWSRLAGPDNADRLLSRPIVGLDNALMALAKVPDNTALRAMTSILADYNCTKQQYHLVTTPIRTADGPVRVKRILEEQTGHAFEVVGGTRSHPNGRVA